MKPKYPYTNPEACPLPTDPSASPTAPFWRRWYGRLSAVTAIPALLALSTPHASAEVAPVLYGVNLAGGDATGNGNVPGTYGTDYIYPNDNELAYYQSKGLTLIRLPIKWKRLQDNLNGPLNATRMGHLDNVITLARNRGMKIILDLHDYNEYSISGVKYLVGTPQVPQSSLTHLWGMLADRYKNETAIYGYDIMNEPKGSATVWASTAQLTINAIRQYDTQHWILVEGIHSSRAWGWVKDGNAAALVGMTDSANKLIFSAHSYWDSGGAGQYPNTYAADNRYPEVGVTHVKPFVEWCNANGFNGLIGEYGVPWNAGYIPEWNTVMNNFLSYLKANNISGTYWCGGPWSASYNLTCEPTSNFTVDKPVMSVLQNYNNNAIPGALPAGWNHGDVGTVGLPGSATYTSNVYTVNGSGSTIGGSADSFQFAHKDVTGDCTIIARVVSQTNTSQYARAGVMIRDGLAANAMHASSIVTPGSGLYLMSRSATGGNATSGSGGAGAVPYWVKLTRVGNVFTSYKSSDGSTWTQMSTPKTIAVASTAKVGLAVCSYANSSLGTATFDNVSVTTP